MDFVHLPLLCVFLSFSAAYVNEHAMYEPQARSSCWGAHEVCIVSSFCKWINQMLNNFLVKPNVLQLLQLRRRWVVIGLVVWATKGHRKGCSSNSSLSSVIFHSLFLVIGSTAILSQGQVTTICVTSFYTLTIPQQLRTKHCTQSSQLF